MRLGSSSSFEDLGPHDRVEPILADRATTANRSAEPTPRIGTQTTIVIDLARARPASMFGRAIAAVSTAHQALHNTGHDGARRFRKPAVGNVRRSGQCCATPPIKAPPALTRRKVRRGSASPGRYVCAAASRRATAEIAGISTGPEATVATHHIEAVPIAEGRRFRGQRCVAGTIRPSENIFLQAVPHSRTPAIGNSRRPTRPMTATVTGYLYSKRVSRRVTR
jgi:hypothetical protein